LVADNHLTAIGSLYWPKQQRHAPCRVLTKNVNRASTIFRLAALVIHVLIGWRQLFTKYWWSLLANTTATCSLPHPENERQESINSLF
jgi:hypothetical protein